MRAVVFAGLFSLAGGILYTGWHTGDLARALAMLRSWLQSSSASTTGISSRSNADDTAAAWRAWQAEGKRWSSDISQAIGAHIPKAAVAMAKDAAASVDAVITGPTPDFGGGSYSFTHTVTVLPGTTWWPGGGGGRWIDCRQTNTCGGGGGTDCHQTNSCGGGGTDCHQTNTCGGSGGHHDVDESSSIALLMGAVALLFTRRRFKPGKAPSPGRAGCHAVPGSR